MDESIILLLYQPFMKLNKSNLVESHYIHNDWYKKLSFLDDSDREKVLRIIEDEFDMSLK